MEKINKGDILIDRDGCKHKVLGKRKDKPLYLLSKHNNFEQEGHLWTLEEIKEKGNKTV